MSTRATYQFKGEAQTDITFYIHHDGYPTGAAQYFKKMRDYESQMKTYNHSLAEVFFRANDNAEFTGGHDYHGDTAYQYTLTMPEEYRFGNREHILEVKFARGKIIFKGTVDDFIAKASQIESGQVSYIKYPCDCGCPCGNFVANKKDYCDSCLNRWASESDPRHIG